MEKFFHKNAILAIVNAEKQLPPFFLSCSDKILNKEEIKII